MYFRDTIAAIATATGAGAIGIVRISGDEAEAILRRCTAGLPATLQSHRLYWARVIHPQTKEILDEALVVLMLAPHSFTGESVAEIQCHGGTYNLQRVFAATLCAGARMAQAGEFSARAYHNGKMDLTQAEAIAGIIEAEDQTTLRVAQAQLGGALRRPIEALREVLLELLTRVEASIDFVEEEDIAQMATAEVAERLQPIQRNIEQLLQTYTSGRLSLAGARVVLMGAPNVGKSALFNALLGQDRAIVTPVAGTTRDVLEERVAFGGHRIHLIDTAGLRPTSDVVERIGVERSMEQITTADIVCWVLDATTLSEAIAFPKAWGDGHRVLGVVNKIDKIDPEQRSAWRQHLPHGMNAVAVSALTGEGLAHLEQALVSRLVIAQGRSEADVPLVTSLRHVQALNRAQQALLQAVTALDGQPLELVAADLHDAATALGEIIGTVTTEDILARIFSQFCVGK